MVMMRFALHLEKNRIDRCCRDRGERRGGGGGRWGGETMENSTKIRQETNARKSRLHRLDLCIVCFSMRAGCGAPHVCSALLSSSSSVCSSSSSSSSSSLWKSPTRRGAEQRREEKPFLHTEMTLPFFSIYQNALTLSPYLHNWPFIFSLFT